MLVIVRKHRNKDDEFLHKRTYKQMKLQENSRIKVGFSPSKKNYFYFLQWKPFKNDEKYFLFHLKSSFRSQDI